MYLNRRLGITFRIHPLLIVIMMTSILTGYFIELLTLFSIVFIHELGHVAAARWFNWRITEVQLLPFGGVMNTDEQGTVPVREELVVALAGPMMNILLVIAALCLERFGWWEAGWSQYFIQANLIIAGFNMLPILPLDGGKVMQCLCSLVFHYYRSIYYCTWISIILSGLLTVSSIARLQTTGIELNLLMIGLFLFYSNIYQLRHLPYYFIRFLVHRELRAMQLIAKGVMASPIIVNRTHLLNDLIRMFMRERYHLIYVMNEGQSIAAVLPEQQVVRHYLMEKQKNRVVSDLFMIE